MARRYCNILNFSSSTDGQKRLYFNAKQARKKILTDFRKSTEPIFNTFYVNSMLTTSQLSMISRSRYKRLKIFIFPAKSPRLSHTISTPESKRMEGFTNVNASELVFPRCKSVLKPLNVSTFFILTYRAYVLCSQNILARLQRQ